MNYDAFAAKFDIKLNLQQQEAVQAVNGPVLLLAVPGSGKTTVLVTRLGFMIYECGIRPDNILTLTYTVAATNDMKERFCQIFGCDLGIKPEFRTINGICAAIIKQYGIKIGKEPFRLENDEKVLLQIISVCYQKYEKEYPTESDLKGIKTYITYIKNMMLSEDEIFELQKEAKCHLVEIYKDYCNELKMRNCMDYDDQMIYAYRLLKSVPWLLEYYQNRYSYLCVDEAQDTSKIQHEIISLLAMKNKNIFMVGDEDQSIYGFRAAYPAALLQFEKKYPEAKVLLMEENFRSNANIVQAANNFIQINSLRHKKQMSANRNAESEICEISLNSRKAQYSYLLEVAKKCEKQTAVLYRDNESVIPLVDLLERNNIKYRMRNGELSFFTHRVVVDIQNILKFCIDMKNTEVFEFIYYKLSTYLSKQMALKACELSQQYHISVFAAILGYFDLKPHMRRNLKALETHFQNMRNETPARALHRIVHFMGYGEYMERSGSDDSKIFLLTTMAEREDSIDSFLCRMEELKNIIGEKKSQWNCPIILSTIHGSKGLEYDNVFLMDVQDGIFPEEVPKDLKKAGKEEIEVYEEERRLFYVGITRARDNLYLFQTPGKSTFISQLLNKKPDVGKKIINAYLKTPKISDLKQKPENGIMFTDKEFEDFLEKLSVGKRVIHKKIGEGVVVEADVNNITILFDGEEKKFNSKFVFLKKLLKSI